jgi:hypothetical protein
MLVASYVGPLKDGTDDGSTKGVDHRVSPSKPDPKRRRLGSLPPPKRTPSWKQSTPIHKDRCCNCTKTSMCKTKCCDCFEECTNKGGAQPFYPSKSVLIVPQHNLEPASSAFIDLHFKVPTTILAVSLVTKMLFRVGSAIQTIAGQKRSRS